jgi:hypothetical protein
MELQTTANVVVSTPSWPNGHLRLGHSESFSDTFQESHPRAGFPKNSTTISIADWRYGHGLPDPEVGLQIPLEATENKVFPLQRTNIALNIMAVE